MTTDEDFLDRLYEELCMDETVRKCLGIEAKPNDTDFWTVCMGKIRREITPLDFAISENLNFISMYYSSTTETDNAYVVRAFLQVDYYTKDRPAAVELKEAVREVIRKMDSDIRFQNSYNIASPTKGISHYRDTYRPLLLN